MLKIIHHCILNNVGESAVERVGGVDAKYVPSTTHCHQQPAERSRRVHQQQQQAKVDQADSPCCDVLQLWVIPLFYVGQQSPDFTKKSRVFCAQRGRNHRIRRSPTIDFGRPFATQRRRFFDRFIGDIILSIAVKINGAVGKAAGRPGCSSKGATKTTQIVDHRCCALRRASI